MKEATDKHGLSRMTLFCPQSGLGAKQRDSLWKMARSASVRRGGRWLVRVSSVSIRGSKFLIILNGLVCGWVAAASPDQDVLLKDIPHVFQKPDFCGEACAEMWLRKLGAKFTQDDVFNVSGVDPLAGRGCYTAELTRALKQMGFKVGDVWFKIQANRADEELLTLWKALHDDLLQGIPSIVCTRFDEKPSTTEHFRLVVGYDPQKEEVIYHEPAKADGAFCRMKRELFFKLWPLKYNADQWTVVRLRLEKVFENSVKDSPLLTPTIPPLPRGRERGGELGEVGGRELGRRDVGSEGRPPVVPLVKGDKSSRQLTFQTLSEPGVVPDQPTHGGFTPADYAQHVMELRKKIPKDNFSVILEPPFVVIGDEPRVVVQKRAANTVKWAVEKLKRDYFEKTPEHIIDIWLFKDKESYETNTQKIFGEEPHTPYGYYSPVHQALIMNIATGGGTLVHEIVHPFVRANFPECPAWFNEGLGSLYEQCDEKEGHIQGRTNWRLDGLQKAIQKRALPTFQQLLSTTDHEFYREDSGTNYAQARYLCHYLQEKDLLVKFYHAFHKGHRTDSSGYEILREILGEKDMRAFQKKWEAYVMRLSFP